MNPSELNSPSADMLPAIAEHQMSRRGLLRVGGMTVAFAALVAACGDDLASDKHPARIGTAPTVPKLPDGVVTDGVLFRTATSVHYSIISGYNDISKKLGKLTADQTKIVDDYITAHQAAIKDLQAWSTKAGSKPWTCSNPRFDRIYLQIIKDRITGRPKQGSEETDVAPSDDPNRDAVALVHELEALTCAMHQSLVPQFSLPTYRAAIIPHGNTAARRAAAIAHIINPDNIVNPTTLENANVNVTTTTAPATTTTIQNIAQSSGGGATTTTAPSSGELQQYYAIPSQFGILSAVQFAVGAFPSGQQFTLNIETPSLNSFIYDYMTDC
ncbi:MAG: hypothetical protein JWM34_1394 [Ilumatobacteraceae bacterium]|nr:hypothetical protein [Ilumatobacteraceae bacterium]